VETSATTMSYQRQLESLARASEALETAGFQPLEKPAGAPFRGTLWRLAWRSLHVGLEVDRSGPPTVRVLEPTSGEWIDLALWVACIDTTQAPDLAFDEATELLVRRCREFATYAGRNDPGRIDCLRVAGHTRIARWIAAGRPGSHVEVDALRGATTALGALVAAKLASLEADGTNVDEIRAEGDPIRALNTIRRFEMERAKGKRRAH
jgi:hypothetical protein